MSHSETTNEPFPGETAGGFSRFGIVSTAPRDEGGCESIVAARNPRASPQFMKCREMRGPTWPGSCLALQEDVEAVGEFVSERNARPGTGDMKPPSCTHERI